MGFNFSLALDTSDLRIMGSFIVVNVGCVNVLRKEGSREERGANVHGLSIT